MQRDFRSQYLGWRTLKRGYDSILAWWDDVKDRSKSLIVYHSRRLTRARRQNKSNLLTSFSQVTARLDGGSRDPDLLAELERVKAELKALDDLRAEGARGRSRIRQLQVGESPSGHFFRLEFGSRRGIFYPCHPLAGWHGYFFPGRHLLRVPSFLRFTF